jgi:GNAT superfamily N-acetyltransferase
MRPAPELRRVDVEAIRPLRQEILRPSLPLEASAYAQDDEPQTAHFAAYDGDVVIGCVTVFPEALDDVADAWRLRGMATAESVRGTGVGALLLNAAIDHVRAEGASVLWCNARDTAEGFYARYGFAPVGELFDVPPLGPHRFMRLALAPPRGG